MDFGDGDQRLLADAEKIQILREDLGLDELIGGLQAVIINTEPDLQQAAVEELLRYTGLYCVEGFEDSSFRTYVLKNPGSSEFRSADLLIRSRISADNPFYELNLAPKSKNFPNTRLETFVFESSDIEAYVSIQRTLGAEFLTPRPIDYGSYYYIQTLPSSYTGNSLGVIQWKGGIREYISTGSEAIRELPEKPDLPHLRQIRWLDHAATRVRALERNQAILEFMKLTNYSFDFAIYVKSLNSITSVARYSPSDFAMVFTSGIAPYFQDDLSGPTEKFIRNYGTRVHHLAFQTENIDETYRSLGMDGLEFLIELVGSPKEGLSQTFSQPSKNTMLVTEYIHRYGDFDGFFTKSNVTLLTKSTEKQ